MAQLTHDQYNTLEDAVAKSKRIAVSRRGTELIIVPLAMRILNGREAIEAQNPTTGDDLTVYIDEMDSVHPL